MAKRAGTYNVELSPEDCQKILDVLLVHANQLWTSYLSIGYTYIKNEHYNINQLREKIKSQLD